ncbi:MAG: nuclear transport factor 2 family protein [Pseudomonadota bacterium]
MSLEDNKALVRTAYESVSAGNLDGFMDRLTDDVKWTFFGNHRFATTFVGKEDILTNLFEPLAGQLVDGLRLNLNKIIAEGDTVVVEATGESEVKSGGTYNNIYCYVVTVRDGKIAEMREYLDTSLVSRVFGDKLESP